MARNAAPVVSLALALTILISVANAQTVSAPTVPLSPPVVPAAVHCTPNWVITGYFTPVEWEYSGKLLRVYVGKELRRYPSDFLDEVLLQGSGLLPDGTYLSYANGWRIVDAPYGSSGKPIAVGDVATDVSVLPFGSKVQIDGQTYTAADTGGAIIGKHIDIYEGVGLDARAKALSLASTSTVCTL